MSFRDGIVPQMEVLTSDGTVLGKVGSIEGDAIALTQAGSPVPAHSRIPLSLVGRVDRHVHLTATRAGLAAALAGAGAVPLGAVPAAGAPPAEPIEGPLPPVRNPAVGNARPRGNYYLPWVLGALLLLVLLFVTLRGCDTEEGKGRAPGPVTGAVDPGRGQSESGRYAAGTIAFELDRFLAGGDPAPRTLVFDKLNFDTGSAVVRPEDVADLDHIAQVLNAYPRTRIAIIGYADARGSRRANARLGGQRADAIVGALVARGISAERLEGRSGGEAQPVGSNRSAEGQAENRRTELIVLTR